MKTVVMLRILVLLVAMLIPTIGSNKAFASCSTFQGCPGTDYHDDVATFSVSGTFFDPIITYAYGREHTHDLVFWTCRDICTSNYQLHWWGECQVNSVHDTSDRVCARLIQSDLTYICVFYDPIDSPGTGLDKFPAMSPFHGEIQTTCKGSGANMSEMLSFVGSSGTVCYGSGDCTGGKTDDNCTGLTYEGDLTSMSLSGIEIPTCVDVFGKAQCATPATLTTKSLITYMGTFGQILSSQQAQQYVTFMQTNLSASDLANTSLPLNAPLPAGAYETSPGYYAMNANPIICATVPVAPAPPPFCTPMPIAKPMSEVVQLCTVSDFVGYSQTSPGKMQPYYNIPANSTINSPCENGMNGIVNSFTTPSARITFSSPVDYLGPPPGSNKVTNPIAISTATNNTSWFTKADFTYQTSDVRVLYGITDTDIDYATSPVSGFDYQTGSDDQSKFAPIAANIANFIDLSFNANQTTQSQPASIIDTDGNTDQYYLSTLSDAQAQQASMMAGTYVYQTSNGTSFPLGMISIPGAPKPLVAPCGGSNSDPNILINGNAWTLSNAKCSTPSTHSNPSIAWTIDRSNSTISNYQSVDYLTSYIYKVQEAQKANGQISSISAREPAMLGVMLSASVVDENGNGIPTSSGANQTCTQPSNIYGCYYVNSTSSIQCGKSNGQIVAGFTPDTKKDTYLSGLEFILDTSNQVNCPSVGTSPAPPPVSPLKYSRGAKFVCGVGGTDVGSVLSQYATSPVAPSTTLNWNSTPQCDNNAKDIVSNDVQLRIDPAPSSSGVSAYVPSSSIQTTLGSSAAATQYYSDLGYINSILTNPNAYLSNMILPATPAGITQPQPNQATCSNSRNKVPLESGFCVAVPQPTCINAYQTNYGAVDQSNQQQTVDGYANWDIPANQAYGTPFAGTCLANTMPNSNGAPLRFCTLDSTKGNNVAVLSQIYNPCAPIPPPPPWWPSSATYTATSGNAIPDNLWATAWNDINIRFTDGTNKFANTPPTSYPSGTVNNASTIGEVPTVILASGDIIPAYLPNPYLNNCVPVTIPGYKNVQICAADNTYYYKYSGGLRGQNIVTYNSTTKCIPRGITYSDGTGNTGFPLDAYKVGINQTDTSGPCCPSGTESGTQGYCGICCGTPSYMYGAVTSVWINGQIDNTCMKNTCASGN